MNFLRWLNAIGATTLPEQVLCQDVVDAEMANRLRNGRAMVALFELEAARKKLELEVMQIEVEKTGLEAKL
jgi:hypothetical protein